MQLDQYPARRARAPGRCSGSLLVADRQTAGRGRRGRQWLSTPASRSHLLPALALRGRCVATRRTVAGGRHRGGTRARTPGRSPALASSGRTTSCSTAARSAASWSNWNPSRRHAGGDRHRPQPATAAGAGEDEFLHRPAALSQALSPLPDRHQILAQLLIDLAAVLDRFVEGGFSVLRSDWQGHHSWQDRQVRLLDGDRIDRQGDLSRRRRRWRPAAAHAGRHRTLPVRRSVAACRMIIAIDAGNSRIKWGVHDGSNWLDKRRPGDLRRRLAARSRGRVACTGAGGGLQRRRHRGRRQHLFTARRAPRRDLVPAGERRGLRRTQRLRVSGPARRRSLGGADRRPRRGSTAPAWWSAPERRPRSICSMPAASFAVA
jgi:BirA family biotin operon repressor/biotin-[acetyl-CoA-carboxylase] ligase